MKIEIGHVWMAAALLSLVTILGYMAGHITGLEAYRMVGTAAATAGLTYMIANMLK